MMLASPSVREMFVSAIKDMFIGIRLRVNTVTNHVISFTARSRLDHKVAACTIVVFIASCRCPSCNLK